MGRIYKYELMRRKKTIFIFLGIMAALTAVSSTTLMFVSVHELEFGSGLMLGLTIIALIGIPSVMGITCSAGHVGELLYKDTNYLMLSIPVPTWKIILGRMLAGITEIVIYTVSACTLGLILLLASLMKVVNHGPDGIFSVFREIFATIVLNPLALFWLILFMLSSTTLVGTTILLVRASTRSFIRRKRLAEAVSVIGFLFIYTWIVNSLGNFCARHSSLLVEVPIKFYSYNFEGPQIRTEIFSIPIPIVIFFFLVSAGFFLLGSWLIKNKVEV